MNFNKNILKIKKTIFSKKSIIFMVELLVMACYIFAQDSVTSINNAVNEKLDYIVQFIYSPWVKMLFGIVLGGKAISFIINHEPGTFKKLIPLAAVALIYFAAPKVANLMITSNNVTFKDGSFNTN